MLRIAWDKMLDVSKSRHDFFLGMYTVPAWDLNKQTKKPALRVGGPLCGGRMRSHKLEARILHEETFLAFAMACHRPTLSCPPRSSGGILAATTGAE